MSYSPRLPHGWWLQRPAYRRYMLRELSCVPIGAYAAMLIVGLYRLGQGAQAWEGFRAALGSGPGLALQAFALVFAVYHSVTWFALAPRTMPLQFGVRHVPAAWIAGAHYLLWAVITFGLLWVVGA